MSHTIAFLAGYVAGVVSLYTAMVVGENAARAEREARIQVHSEIQTCRECRRQRVVGPRGRLVGLPAVLGIEPDEVWIYTIGDGWLCPDCWEAR